MSTYTEPAPIRVGTTDANGTTIAEISYQLRDANRRLPAFLALAHTTGGVYGENLAGMSIDQALHAAGLDFTVAKFNGLTVDTDHGPVTGLDKLRATVATWPDDSGRPPTMLGVVGKDYQVAQPYEVAGFAQALVDESGGNIVAIVSYGDPVGSRMALAVKLPDQLLIGGSDPHDLYAVVGNSFNRETSVWGCAAPIRIGCTNQVAAVFGKYASRFTIPHRGDLSSKVEAARDTLNITHTFGQVYAEAAEVMLAEPMGPAEVDAFLEELFPTPETVKTARGADNWDARRSSISTVIHRGENNTFGRGTRYAAYHGVVEYLDHVAPYAGGRRSNPAARYARVVDGGQAEQLKQRAARLLLAGV